MTYDYCWYGFKPKSGFELYEIVYEYDTRDLPIVGSDIFRCPSHVSKPTGQAFGCLLADAYNPPQYKMASQYYTTNSNIICNYNQDPQEGRQSINPDTREAECWVKDYNGNWHRLGRTADAGCDEIGSFDVMSEIYYEGSMNLPSTQKNYTWIRWIRTNQGWKNPKDCIYCSDDSSDRATWAKIDGWWVGVDNKELRFDAYIVV
jgi:hypothetical protein